MLGCNIGRTRRAVPFWEEDRTDGTISKGGYSTYFGAGEVQPRVHFPATKTLYWLQNYGLQTTEINKNNIKKVNLSVESKQYTLARKVI